MANLTSIVADAFASSFAGARPGFVRGVQWLCVAVLLMLPAGALADVFAVTTTADSGAGSLRQAVLNANSNPGADTITFEGATFTDAVPDEIRIFSGEMIIWADVTIAGPGARALTVRSTKAESATSRVFYLAAGNSTIRGMTITGGNLPSAGVGSAPGAGIAVGGGSLLLRDCAVMNNMAGVSGGGLAVLNGGVGVTVIGCTFSGNTSRGTGGGAAIDFGGVGSTLTMINTTLSGNAGTNPGVNSDTGAIFNGGGTAVLTNCTITNNAAAGTGTNSTSVWAASGSTTLRNCIIAGNQSNATKPDVKGAFTSSVNNVVGNVGTATGLAHGANGNQSGSGASPLNPLLSALADNGGRTDTHGLQDGSPAINAGSSAVLPADAFDIDNDSNVSEAIPFDQRGFGYLRTQNSAPDVGAFESGNLVIGKIREAEPNNGTATANFLPGTSAVVRGNVYPEADVDYYAFSALAGDRVYAAVMTQADASPGAASKDSNLTLFSTNGTTVLEEDISDGTLGPGSSSIAGTAIPADGTYYLRVKHDAATSTMRPYDLYLQVRRGTPVAEVENNSTFPGQPMPAGRWVSGNLSSGLDVDRFAMTLNAGDTVFLSLDADPERDGTTWNPTLGFWLTQVGNLHNMDDPNTASPNSEAYFVTVKHAGTYTVNVASSGSVSFGTYRLSASVVPASGQTGTVYSNTVARSIPNSVGSVTSTIAIPSTSGRMKKLKVGIDLVHPAPAELDVTLTSPQGNAVALFTDLGPSTGIDVILDDDAAVPLGDFPISALGVIAMPENPARLDWFKGQGTFGTWTLTIHVDQAGSTPGNLRSWNLEVIEEDPLPAGAPTVLYASDFEANDGGFTHSGTFDEWERGLPTAPPLVTANSGTKCWKTDLDGEYQVNASFDLFSPTIDLTAIPPGVPIVFEWFMQYHMHQDHFNVRVEEVGGAGTVRSVHDWRDGSMSTTVGTSGIQLMQAAGWGRHRALISDFAGKVVRLRFHLDSDATGAFRGVAIDDVSVTAFGAPVQEIVVKGNGFVIGDGDTTPSLTDHTEFGSTALAGGTVTRTFRVENAGVAALSLTGTPKVSVGGTHAADFTVTQQPSASVSGGGFTMFAVTFDPSAGGVRQATLSIASNDADENPYDFSIRGTGNTLPTVVGAGIPDQTLVTTQSKNIDLRPYFTDPDGGALTFSVFSNDPGIAASAVMNANGTSVDITGVQSFALSTFVTIQARDSLNGIVTDTFQILVLSPEPTTPGVTVNPVLKGQTGLFEVPVEVTNPHPVSINGFRLRVTNLPTSLKLYNATSPIGVSEVYADHAYPMGPGEKVTMTLVFYSSTRRWPAGYVPTISVETLPLPVDNRTTGAGVQVTRATVQKDGSVLLEWTAVIGKWYRVKFSNDGMATWLASQVPIKATSTRIQWSDKGPPLTNSHPSTVGSRFYRVEVIPSP